MDSADEGDAGGFQRARLRKTRMDFRACAQMRNIGTQSFASADSDASRCQVTVGAALVWAYNCLPDLEPVFPEIYEFCRIKA